MAPGVSSPVTASPQCLPSPSHDHLFSQCVPPLCVSYDTSHWILSTPRLPARHITQDHLISRSSTSLHLQRPYFQIRSHSQLQGLDLDMYFGGLLLNLLYTFMNTCYLQKSGKQSIGKLEPSVFAIRDVSETESQTAASGPTPTKVFGLQSGLNSKGVFGITCVFPKKQCHKWRLSPQTKASMICNAGEVAYR